MARSALYFLFPFGPGLPSPSSRATGPSLSPASDDTRLLQHQFRVLRWVHTIIWIIHTQQVTSRMGKHLESQNLCWPVVVGRKGDPDLAIKPGNRKVWSFHLFFCWRLNPPARKPQSGGRFSPGVSYRSVRAAVKSHKSRDLNQLQRPKRALQGLPPSH